MKFFHLSDLHIGLKLYNRDLAQDQRYILDEIADLARQEKPDAIVIAGDIYDKAVPSAEAVDLFDHFISELSQRLEGCEIMMISGNHDSPSRVNVYRQILQQQKIHMIGLPPMREGEYIEKVVMNDEFGEVSFFLLPFVKPSMVRTIVGTDEKGNNLSYDETLHRLIRREAEAGHLDPAGRNVLVSHQFYLPAGTDADQVERMASEIVTVGNIDQVNADILSLFDYAALGHIHKPMSVGSEFFRYCGTPIACSLSEEGQTKGVIEVEMREKGNVSTRVLALRPLHRVRSIQGSADEVLAEPSEDYVRVVLTDRPDESPLRAADLLDGLRKAFPNMLEVVREYSDTMDYEAGSRTVRGEKMQPYDLCEALLAGRADAEELKLLREIINEAEEV